MRKKIAAALRRLAHTVEPDWPADVLLEWESDKAELWFMPIDNTPPS